MARPRQFDPDIALDRAMQVFWRLGYDAASLPDLLAGMGMTRGSLYKAFTDKRTLFLAVLDRYGQAAVDPAVAMLENAGQPDGLARIGALFDMVVADVRDGNRRGCLLCSAAIGPAASEAMSRREETRFR